MLNRLRSCKETRIQRFAVGILLTNIVAFLDDALNGLAGLRLGLLADHLEHFFETLHMTFRLFEMGRERILQFVRLCGLRHLRECLPDCLLGKIDVPERIVKQVLEIFRGP